ncbi:hypothetical protein ACROYT_G002046 [Oculina patagonica]
MFKAFHVVVLGLFFISVSFSLRRDRRHWRGLANCLGMGVSQQANVSSNDILRFIRRRQYMIVSEPNQFSETLTANAPNRMTRSVGFTLQTRCPFKYEIIDYVDTIPRFLVKAVCTKQCDSHCKPVMYPHKLLFRKCKNYWMWTQKTLAVAFVWVLDD